jgi:hypothetical protein
MLVHARHCVQPSTFCTDSKPSFGSVNFNRLVNDCISCLAQLQVPDPGLFAAIASASSASVGQFEAQDVANLIWAFAKAEYHDSQLVALLADRAQSIARDFSSQVRII